MPVMSGEPAPTVQVRVSVAKFMLIDVAVIAATVALVNDPEMAPVERFVLPLPRTMLPVETVELVVAGVVVVLAGGAPVVTIDGSGTIAIFCNTPLAHAIFAPSRTDQSMKICFPNAPESRQVFRFTVIACLLIFVTRPCAVQVGGAAATAAATVRLATKLAVSARRFTLSV